MIITYNIIYNSTDTFFDSPNTIHYTNYIYITIYELNIFISQYISIIFILLYILIIFILLYMN
jgi:hypothetical protein